MKVTKSVPCRCVTEAFQKKFMAAQLGFPDSAIKSFFTSHKQFPISFPKRGRLKAIIPIDTRNAVIEALTAEQEALAEAELGNTVVEARDWGS
jgi:hypothetical protein